MPTDSSRPVPTSTAPDSGAAPTIDLPRVSPRLVALFGRYARWYLRRHFHAVRRLGPAPEVAPGAALVVYFNHPAWWDPLLALVLAGADFPQRTHYGPIDAGALGRYGFFRRLGFFGVEPGTVSGARRFLAVSEALLARRRTALWITPEGRFTDPRRRPVRLQPGLGRLAARLAERSALAAEGGGPEEGALLVPLAIEYPFWDERFPEALLSYGEPVELRRTSAELLAESGEAPSARQWDDLLARRLEEAQDRLAAATLERDPAAFETLIGGRAGIGGLYDLWRSLLAGLRGERFEPDHGEATRRAPSAGAAADAPPAAPRPDEEDRR